VDRQPFSVLLYSPLHDLTGVRVRFTDGAGTWVTGAVSGRRGPYDVWEVQLPAATHDTVRYYFELSDGPTRRYWGTGGLSTSPPADSGHAVDFATLAHAPIGTTPVPGGTVFKVWAPSSNQTWVQGEFNGFGLADELPKVGDYFIGRVSGTQSGQRYQYFFDGGVPNFDPRGRVYEPIAGYTHSRLDDPSAYTWTSNDYVTPPLGQMVVYQLNVGTFCGRNDPDGATSFPSGFADVAARVRHLAALGVNAVLLNPVTASPNLTYAGYECITPWSPNAQYGTPAQLKLLIDTCHAHGIAVLCDIVWNHVPPSANYLWEYNGLQLYFSDPPTQTPWGPQADFSVPEVADFYAESALQWLEEYRIDGFRMDAVAYMATGTKPWAGWGLMQRFNTDLERRWMDKVTIAEEFPLTPQVTNPVGVGGAGFDAQYNGDNVFYLTGAAYEARFDGFFPAYYLGSALTTPGTLTAPHQAFNYFELHDNAWGPSGHRFVLDLERVPGVLDDSAATCMRVMTGALMLGPGVPGMLMGDEWLDETPWGTTMANRIDWSRRAANAPYWQWTHDLLRIRTHLPAFFADSPSQILHQEFDNNVISWMRHDDAGNVFLVVANLGGNDFPLYQLGAPLAGAWVQELNSQGLDYGGNGMGNAPLATVPTPWDGMPQSLIMTLPHLSVVVLRAVATTAVPAVATTVGTRLDAVFPSPMRESATVAFTLARDGQASLTVYDARGARVAGLVDGPLAAGPHLLRWSGRDASGRAVAPGVYFVHLDAAGARATRKLAVLR
jgi:1,4-alpha-glucan branching enzyme